MKGEPPDAKDLPPTRMLLQLAGFMNLVTDNMKGFQFAGGFNVTGESFEGLQASLIGNAAGADVLGSATIAIV